VVPISEPTTSAFFEKRENRTTWVRKVVMQVNRTKFFMQITNQMAAIIRERQVVG